jgi:septum formation protein
LFLKSPPLLILGSTSRYRRELLARLGVPFECAPPGIDESPLPQESPHALVSRLARSKARAVAQQRPGAWVIGSDQLAVLERHGLPARILGKPGSTAHCIDQLATCSGQRLAFLTAVAVLRDAEPPQSEFIDTTVVTFRPLDRATIERYVEHESPLDCAGGFKSEGLGITLCESIESTDPTALIGLPLIRVAAALRLAGFELP